MDPGQVTAGFAQHYYGLFGTNRAGLASLYKDASTLCFEGSTFKGAQAIIGKLTSLQFGKLRAEVISKDWLPGPNGSLLIMVNGSLQLEGEANKLKFSQCFTLIAEGSAFWIFNDMFRINVG